MLFLSKGLICTDYFGQKPTAGRKMGRWDMKYNHFHNRMDELVVKPQGYFGWNVISKDKLLTMIIFNKSGLTPTGLERETIHRSRVPP